jgi:hypothetical protein
MDANRKLFNTFAAMRKLLLLVSLATVLTYSCKTDFDVTSDWKDISIVYGLLDPTDTAQYIKVTKAFLDKKVSALTIAQIPDSLYYTDITVQLEQYQNSVLKKTIDLQKVDGNLEGYVKDTGIFANAPNYLYKTKEVMDQNSSYKLVITISDNGKIVTSSTEIINDFLVTIPSPLQKVNFKPGAQYHVQWTSAKDGKIYGLVIRFHYKEVNASDPTISVEKYLDWTITNSNRSNSTDGGESMFQDIDGSSFYTFVNANLDEDPSVYRVSENFDFIFSVGGEELDNYNQVTLAQEGLTSGTIEPEYTNVDNGLGLYSTRFHKTIFAVPIDIHTVDTLACSAETKNLRFQNSVGGFCF